MVNPFKLFLVLLTILILLAIPSLIMPPEGLRFGSCTFKYPSIYQLFDLDSAQRSTEFVLMPELAKLDLHIDSIALDFEIDTITFHVDTLAIDDTTTTVSVDTFSVQKAVRVTGNRITADILKSRRVSVELPDSSFSALEPFFHALATGQTSRKLVRIMHYGDSQIEGDRITAFLRSRLQARFGGRGVGLLHAVPHSYQPGAVHQTVSGNWQQLLMPDFGKGAVAYRFGLLGGYSRFTASRRATSGGFTEAWITLQRRGSHQSPARNFTRCKVFYGYNAEPFMASISYAGTTQDADMIGPTHTLSHITWNVPVSSSNIQIDFKGDDSPMVFGISLESATGIVVDNIAIRGSSGADFTRADDASLKKAMQLVDAKLIILQFGVNIVPHVVESYKYYENQMYQQILALKKAKPDAAILLVGVSDMSRREGGRYVSYPNIEKIRDAQRNAAKRGGAAFWDCYSAMGGQNSMPAWVYANPPLASKDFVHFTYRGSNLIAELFYSSLMDLYEQYVESLHSN